MMDRSKPAPGRDALQVGLRWWTMPQLGAFATEAEAIAATWAAYDREHAEAIADFAERAAAELCRPYVIDSLEERQTRFALADWLLAFAKGGAR